MQGLTLDTWCDRNRQVPSLIKIDVEDAAVNVLKGASFILQHGKPIVICEILNDQIGELAMKLLPQGYSFYLIDENNGLKRESRIGRYDWRYLNWLFIPTEKEWMIQDQIPAATWNGRERL